MLSSLSPSIGNLPSSLYFFPSLLCYHLFLVHYYCHFAHHFCPLRPLNLTSFLLYLLSVLHFFHHTSESGVFRSESLGSAVAPEVACSTL
ncbi:hypothetical protein ES319_D06G057500v1 [Gossypium barbadense]|uniref:Uncharacterized protein n=2 Tax=Gossypium TaxID=3633 RepID=A0A5J5QZM0_GOSBA|nr:hypothetical protein ES319_D06G057500v1 [Gossypium barbadense]TYG63855.1 hypothetical protein ES288_D06G062300v1 [Gossypium darwinii]TYG63857.1 hypothetical protein ES288_D06G062300v1 [Gossypium darwinii]